MVIVWTPKPDFDCFKVSTFGPSSTGLYVGCYESNLQGRSRPEAGPERNMTSRIIQLSEPEAAKGVHEIATMTLRPESLCFWSRMVILCFSFVWERHHSV